MNPLLNGTKATVGVDARKLRTLTSRGKATLAEGRAMVLVAADGRVVPAVTDGRVDDGRVAREAGDDFLGRYGSVNLDGRELPFVVPSTLRRMSWADFG